MLLPFGVRLTRLNEADFVANHPRLHGFENLAANVIQMGARYNERCLSP